MRTLLIGAIVLGAIVLALKLLVVWLEPRAAFYPWEGEQETPAIAGLAFDRVAVRTEDGETLAAWWLPGKASEPEILFFHGNGGNLSLWSDVIIGIRNQGWSVFALDYRGYGLSTGRPTETGLYRDADAFIREFWDRRHTAGNRVFYWGRSLGATAAAHAASRRGPAGVILESPLYSARSLVADNPLTLGLGFLMTYRFDTVERLKGYRGPVLVVHGDRDTIIPIEHGRRVFQALQQPKQFVAIPGADHNDLHVANPAVYWAALRRFIETAE